MEDDGFPARAVAVDATCVPASQPFGYLLLLPGRTYVSKAIV